MTSESEYRLLKSFAYSKMVSGGKGGLIWKLMSLSTPGARPTEAYRAKQKCNAANATRCTSIGIGPALDYHQDNSTERKSIAAMPQRHSPPPAACRLMICTFAWLQVASARDDPWLLKQHRGYPEYP
jgi:hypothetical protein